ncbi:hypothetical protein EYZ11_009096 [Aspergillus tanneri]|uniref:protein-L-isoaspartate(D-aspartate) O-methyltransferase n=1 Tax=Aspergillus tanneri TaxID=1220188 RepID=A0A4S3J8P2_9EURO|nr:hypothetical protein EYZ11_009096 [Aspergillus tanneri]
MANLALDPSYPEAPKGCVIGVDHIPELVDLAYNNMRKSEQGRNFLDTGVVKFVTADGRLGWKENAPYDAIHVGAAAETLHPVLVEQLRAPGRMFIPVDAENDGGIIKNIGFGYHALWIYCRMKKAQQLNGS